MAYLALKFLHLIGATVLLGTGAGIAFFMLMAHLDGRPGVNRDGRRRPARYRHSACLSRRLFPARRLDRALDPALHLHRRILAACRLDADAHARPRGGGCGKGGGGAAARLLPAVLDVVRLRLSRLQRRACHLLADDRPPAF